MTDEAVQTPQGEVGASESESQSTPATESTEEKKTSLLGSEQAEETPESDGVNPDDEGVKADGETGSEEDEGTKLKEGEEETEEESGAPDEYAEFSLPEGMELDAAAMEKATPMFKELGLNQENAQKAVDLYAELQQEAAKKQRDALNTMRDEWADKIKEDPEYKKTLANGKRAVEAFGDDELKGLLYDNWLGDHPSMVSFLGKIGAAMNDDKFIEGHAALDDRSRLDRIYNKME